MRGGGEDVLRIPIPDVVTSAAYPCVNTSASIPIPEVVTVDGLPDDVMLVVPGRIPVEIRPDGKVLIRADDLRHVRAVRASESKLCMPVPER